VNYSACNEAGCFPGKAELEVTLKVTDAPPVEGPAAADAAAGAKNADPIRGGLLAFLLAMFLGGLFILVMPCTYPMIPITIAFFTKQADVRQGAVFPLALAYGAGIVLVFNIIGWAFGEVIGAVATHWLLNLSFGILFVLFAFVLFGIFEIRLPSSLNQVASAASRSGGYAGVFFLGAVLVITSFTCTAPILGSLLVFAAKDGNLGRVTLGMTTIGLTVAAPFVVLALIPGKIRNLPRAGEWMHVVKVSLGFVELAAALKFFSNAEIVYQLKILPRELFLAIWVALFLVLGLYLLGVFRLREEEARGIGGGRMLFGIGAICLALYFLYGMVGYRLDPLMEGPILPPYSAQALAAGPRARGAETVAKWTIVADDLDAGLERARKDGKRAMVDFTGHTCVNCRTMEQVVFTKPEVAKALDRYVEIRLHLDAKDVPGEKLERHLAYQLKTTESSGIPTYIIVDPEKPDVVLDRFDGLDLSLGPRFLEFLTRNAKPAD
jgi:thiol:disulfide interchange protein DsbD